MNPPDFSQTLAEARASVMSGRGTKHGVKCPCCDQLAKIYRRPFNGTMLYALVLIERFSRTSPSPTDWVHVPSYLSEHATGRMAVAVRGGDWAKLKFWGFLEEKSEVRDDGSDRAGWWRITQTGRAFLHGQFYAPAAFYLYNGECRGFDEGLVLVRDIKSKHFDFNELMGG